MHSRSLLSLILAGSLMSSSGLADSPETNTSTPAANLPREFHGMPPRVKKAMELAEGYIGVPYNLGGRSRRGIDCQGIIIVPYGKAFNFSWRKVPVHNNKEVVDSGYLGKPVQGLDGVLRENLDPSLLHKGDALYFLIKGYDNPQDTSLLVQGGSEYRTWHTGLYAGGSKKNVLHAAPGDKVRLQPLEEITFDALYVTRRKE